MADFAHEELVNRLLEIRDVYDEEAYEILEKLAEIGEPAIQPMIYKYLGHPDVCYGFDFTHEISEALGKLGEKAVDALIVALNSEQDMLKHNAARALGQIGNARAVESLINVVYTDKPYSAIYALGEIGGDRAA